MSQCPYLVYRQSGGCSGCWGFRCTAGENEKRITDTGICKTWPDYTECVAFLGKTGGVVDAKYLTAPVEVLCPYLGAPPADQHSCTGMWCYARNKMVKVTKGCKNFEICTVYCLSNYKGVPFHASS